MTSENVIDIRREMSDIANKAAKRKELSDKYGVSTHTIYEIETGRARKDVI